MPTLTSQITQDQLTTGQLLAQELIAERYPDASTAPGSAVDGLLIQPSGYLAALHTSRANQALLLGSLQAIVAGQVDATDADVDALVSNYFLTRIPAVNASGYVKIVTQYSTPYTVQVGFQVGYSSLVFQTTTTQRAYPAGTPGITQTASARIITPRSDGKYEFTILVQAAAPGPASRLGRGTVLTLLNPAQGMLSCVVDTDFTGGTLAETNAQLLARAQSGLTNQLVSGPLHLQALVGANFPGAQVASIGTGQGLMVRDRLNLLGGSSGGKLDCYYRAGQTIGRQTVTLSGQVTNVGTRQVTLTIPRGTAEGLYRVVAIRPTGSTALGGLVPATYLWSQVPVNSWTPTQPAQQDLQASSSAQVVVTFLDSLTVGTLMLSQVIVYDLDLVYQPGVQQVTQLLTGPSYRPPGVDLLVKGAVPAQVTCQVTIQYPVSGAAPDIGTSQSLVANAVNALPFGTSQLTSYTIIKALVDQLGTGLVTGVTLQGAIWAPDGSTITLTSAPQLTIPELPGNQVGAANTYWTCGVSDVQVTLVGV